MRVKFKFHINTIAQLQINLINRNAFNWAFDSCVERIRYDVYYYHPMHIAHKKIRYLY